MDFPSDHRRVAIGHEASGVHSAAPGSQFRGQRSALQLLVRECVGVGAHREGDEYGTGIGNMGHFYGEICLENDWH